MGLEGDPENLQVRGLRGANSAPQKGGRGVAENDVWEDVWRPGVALALS